MKISIPLCSGEGITIGNSLRQIALTRTKSIRPIAYSFDIPNNILYSESYILEDMIEFATNLASLTFKPSSDRSDDLIVEQYTFARELYSEKLSSNKIIVKQTGVKLLTSLEDKTILLKVYYLNSSGERTDKDNREYLANSGLMIPGLKILASRHSDLDIFTFDVQRKNKDEETLLLHVKSKVEDEASIILSSIALLRNSLDKIENIMKS